MTVAHTRWRRRHATTFPALCTKQYTAGGSYVPFYGIDEHVESCRDSPHKGPPFTSGSPLELYKLRIESAALRPGGFFLEGFGGTLEHPGREWYGNITHHQSPYYEGNVPDVSSGPVYWTTARQNTWKDAYLPSDADLNSLGATAWNRFKPGKPISSSDQAVLELMKDGLPGLPGMQFVRYLLGAKSKLSRVIGSEYLNVEFGWKPILSDLKSLYKAQRFLEKRMSQLRRDNGLPVRRRGSFPVEIDSNVFVPWQQGNYARPSATGEFYGPANSLSNYKQTKRITKTSVSFSGRFRYWIPDIGTNQWSDRSKQALFGVNPNLSLLYEVMPWSWLIDWFTNLGDVINNMSENAAENLVADYAYIMKEVEVSDHLEVSVLLQNPAAGYIKLVSTSDSVISAHFKMRDSANPYGFGFTFDDLSWRQMAILAALGLSRS